MPCGNYSNDRQKCIDGYFLRITVPLAGVTTPPQRRHDIDKVLTCSEKSFLSSLRYYQKPLKQGTKVL